MNVIIPPKRGDKGSSFNRLVSYISDRGDKPKDDDLVSAAPRQNASRTKKAMFDRLVDYADRNDSENRAVVITDVFPDGRQRLISGGISCETNCFSWETSAAEMNMVAAQSRRCQDPVYHFILSWRENELPTDAQIFECAEHCIRQLGMKGHQYVTAIHQDTDNTHCHVAVNRVNPITYKAAALWNDADTLQKSCRVLERKYGFIQDNGSWQWGVNDQLVRAPFRYGSAPQGTVPLQVYSNTESLYHYAVREVREKISELIESREITWRQIHLALHERGLGLREQGEGLVIYDFLRPEGPVVKASSVHPTLTKFRMEAHIGPFEGPPTFEHEEWSYGISSYYQPAFELRDKDVRFDRRQARAEARLDLKMRYKRYREGWEKPDLHVKDRYQQVAARYQAMKADVKRSQHDPLLRKLLYRVAEFDRMKAMAELRIELRDERQALAEKGLLRPLAYRPWVEQQALRGDVAAVSQLRGFVYREKRKERTPNGGFDRLIQCGQADDSAVYHLRSYTSHLHRDGTVEYLRDGRAGVIDRGDFVHVKPGFNDDDELDNYRLAANLVSTKSGDAVRIIGDDQFVDQVLDAGCGVNHRGSQYVFQVTDPEQLARYDVIERDHRQYYGYDEPEVSTHSPAQHDPMDDVPDDDYQPPRPFVG
ncbi:TraI/MobA(P) family conjugative relaxase [Pseudomonas savastanoi]|uniref:TraI/MobA(P) family conjugative relaxase n=1 Tax=Pseudomonas savastanoi TaxID=29438 RepID=UPI001EDB33F0|nr:TraI/MobA(P) family conjugative relaxase [Pseudomonas savastanoi]UKL12810.1 relaxase/mobilization nuclease domain-containing protein [Pseudomonas savastanoi pv. savastanoi]